MSVPVSPSVRPPVPADAHVLALLYNGLTEPHFHVTAARLAQRLADAPDGRLVAECGGRLLGYASWARFAPDHPRAWFTLLLHPDHREDNTPRALLSAAGELLRPQGVRKLWTSVREDYLGGYPFLPDLGFREQHRTFGGGFYPRTPLLLPAGLEERLAARGIRVLSARELPDVRNDPRVTELYAQLLPDRHHAEPTIPAGGPPLDDPDLLWDGAFVAVLGEQVVGLAVAERTDLGAFNAVLGVRRDVRGQGVGTLLQARMAQWTRTAGLPFLNTAGVTTDTAYLRVLTRLGAHIEPDWIAYEADVPGGER